MSHAVILPAIWALASAATSPAFAAPFLISRSGYARPLSPSSDAAGPVGAPPDLQFVVKSTPGTRARVASGNRSPSHARRAADTSRPRDTRGHPAGAGHLLLDGIAEPLELLARLVPAVATVESLLPPPVRSSTRRALRLAAHGYLLHELRKLTTHQHANPPTANLYRRDDRSDGGRWELDTWEWVAVGAGLATAAVGVTLLLRSDRSEGGEPSRTRGALAEMIFGGVRLSLNNDRGWLQIRGSW